MKFPDVAEVRLGSPPIVKALCQIGFPIEPRLEEEKSIRGFRDAVRPAYPGFQTELVTQGIIGSDQTIQQGVPSHLWNFLSVDNAWRIVLSSTSLTLETTSYTTVSELIERFGGALTFLLKDIGPARRDRLGLRYLNAFTAKGSVPELLSLVNPILHGVAGAEVATENELLSSQSDTRFLIDDGKGQLAIKAGLIPPNAPLDIYPQGFTERVFALDFDLFDIRPQELVPANTIENVEYFHSWIYRAFRWSLSDVGFASCEPLSGQ